MKSLKLLVLSCLISLAPVQNSRAAVAGVAAILGAPVASGLALAGLGSFAAGLLVSTSQGSCDGGGCVVFLALGAMVGVVLLEDGTDTINFVPVDEGMAAQLGVSSEELNIYNSEIEEVNLIFTEVQASLDSRSTVEDSKNLWNESRDLLSV